VPYFQSVLKVHELNKLLLLIPNGLYPCLNDINDPLPSDVTAGKQNAQDTGPAKGQRREQEDGDKDKDEEEESDEEEKDKLSSDQNDNKDDEEDEDKMEVDIAQEDDKHSAPLHLWARSSAAPDNILKPKSAWPVVELVTWKKQPHQAGVDKPAAIL
jgi:ABC-type Zn2+ transport system substrate-binding protein/surface adhesin